MRNRFSRRRSANAGVGHKLVLVFACVAATTLGVLVPGSGDAVKAAAGSPADPATLTLTGAGHSIPRSFFGLSVEYNELADLRERGCRCSGPRDEAHSARRTEAGCCCASAASPPIAPTTRPPRPPNYRRQVITIGPNYLKDLSTLASTAHLRVMLDLNLAVHSPTLAVQFAQAARQMLPGSTLAGLEIGNEPGPLLAGELALQGADRHHQRRLDLQDVDDQLHLPADYRRDWLSLYARTLRAKVPGIPLGGPEIISSKPKWLGCDRGPRAPGPELPQHPSLCLVDLLALDFAATTPRSRRCSARAPHLELRDFRQLDPGAAVEFAHSRHEALRLTKEVNSISCGGNTGVADSFATALWAPDALFELIQAGANSVSWHIRPGHPQRPVPAHVQRESRRCPSFVRAGRVRTDDHGRGLRACLNAQHRLLGPARQGLGGTDGTRQPGSC